MTPSVLQWLGVRIENRDVLIIEILPLLSVPPNLLVIDNGVTVTSSVRFVPFDIAIDGQCVVTGPIRIGYRSFIGNRSVIRSGVRIFEEMLSGSLTRVDSTIENIKKGRT